MERSASKSELVLARLLRPFAKVEPSEAVTAIILTLTVFFLLSGYYLLTIAPMEGAAPAGLVIAGAF
jgi:hypothetical protein